MKSNPAKSAFTLIELLVSMAILAMIVMIMMSMVNQTTSIWSKTTGKVEQFRESREAYEAMTRRLSQATLNTYWDYDNPAAPTKYIRKSDLRYISGRELSGMGSRIRPTHTVFFNAPLGFIYDGKTPSTADKYRGLDYLLNSFGYFIDYSGDADLRPPFVDTPDRKGFRLMESMVPSQEVNIYTYTPTHPRYTTRDWIFGSGGGMTFASRNEHVLAENIIALIILPKLSKSDIQKWNAAGGKYNDFSLLPNSSYNLSSLQGDGWSVGAQKTDPRLNPTNQLPPVIQVAMVAIDEASASRMSEADNQALIAKLAQLFKEPPKLNSDLYGDPNNPSKSEATDSLAEYLVRKRINYRVFNSDVPIRSAKWSTEQKN